MRSRFGNILVLSNAFSYRLWKTYNKDFSGFVPICLEQQLDSLCTRAPRNAPLGLYMALGIIYFKLASSLHIFVCFDSDREIMRDQAPKCGPCRIGWVFVGGVDLLALDLAVVCQVSVPPKWGPTHFGLASVWL